MTAEKSSVVGRPQTSDDEKHTNKGELLGGQL